jgi:deoxyhypusine synthase
MLDSINWKQNFNLREQNGINNAYATIIRNQRYIIYDNIFLENLDSYAKTKWASISVLAHEMGHHYRNHVIDAAGSTPPKEIEADYFRVM